MSFSLYEINLLPTKKINKCLLKNFCVCDSHSFYRSDLSFGVISLQTEELLLSFLSVQVSR